MIAMVASASCSKQSSQSSGKNVVFDYYLGADQRLCEQTTLDEEYENTPVWYGVDGATLAGMWMSPAQDTDLSQQVPVAVVDARITFLKDQQSFYRVLQRQLDLQLSNVDKEVGAARTFRLGFTLYGIFAGLAATVLTTASPAANAAWIAGLSGASASMVSLASQVPAEFARPTLGAAQTELLSNAKDATSRIDFVRLQVRAGIARNAEWEKELTLLASGLSNLQRAICLDREQVISAPVPKESSPPVTETFKPSPSSTKPLPSSTPKAVLK